MRSQSRKSLAQRHFSSRSEAYATSSLLSDQVSLAEIIRLTGVTGVDRVLDTATGTGFLMEALSRTAKEVVATDLTTEMLLHARRIVGHRSNIGFARADAENLPFRDGCFDMVSCRIAFHHFPHPQRALSEMARVCRRDGRVVIADVVSSDDKARSEFHNRMERLFDSSHVKAYRVSELREMMQGTGLAVAKAELRSNVYSLEEWSRVSRPGARALSKVRAMLIESMDGDKSGLKVEQRDGAIFFTYTTATMVGLKGRHISR
jgi:ubiquinone/menaquinone biosynthesis C-methylase UbiE